MHGLVSLLSQTIAVPFGIRATQESLPVAHVRGLGLILVAALNLYLLCSETAYRYNAARDEPDGKPGCQLSHTSCMFCESSFQVLKNLIQLGRLRSRRCFVAKRLDPIFESLKHGQEAEKSAISSHKPGLYSIQYIW
jgi:hypothetical protein